MRLAQPPAPQRQTLPVIRPVPFGEERPFWSVMIPCYNSADLLMRTLTSVLQQDPGPDQMQIEVVDDASADDGAAGAAGVVERFGRGRVSYFRQPTNVGASRNFTACVERSRGEWVQVLHSDDVVLDGYYVQYRKAIERCPDALLVGAQTLLVDDQERYIGVTPPLDTDDGYLRQAAFTLAVRHPLQCVSAVVNRAAFEEAGGFDPSLAHANDWELWTRMASLGPVAWMNHPLGLYRTHAGSDSHRLHRSTQYLDDSLRAVEIIADRFPDPDLQATVRQSGRRIVSSYALDVGMDLSRQGWFRLAAKNALCGVRIAPSVHSATRAADVLHDAARRRMAAFRRQRSG